jgi:hypothetical protein
MRKWVSSMATWDDVRRIALSLPETAEAPNGQTFMVMSGSKPKTFCWVWRERVDPKKPRIPNQSAIALRVASEFDKHALIDLAPDRFFTEPHFDGFPAILVRLAAIGDEELREVMTASWRRQAPKRLAALLAD